MSQDPSPYDLLQDNQISALQDIVTPYYQPPSETEHSFPVVGQGVSSQMFQQISRSSGTGVFIPHSADEAHHPYRLHGMPGGASETNATNQMMLRTSNVSGRSEASIEGFFHTQLEDMPISFPAVSSPTTYYLCLTYDPRREEEPQGPIRIEVHVNDLPSTHGRKHIVLWTVERQPNQLLTDATITRTRQWHSPVISVLLKSNLPDPLTTEYGTVAVVLNAGQDYQDRNPGLYTNRGNLGWIPVVEPIGQWTDIPNFGGWNYTHRKVRHRDGGIDIVLFAQRDTSGGNQHRIGVLPTGYRPVRDVHVPYSTSRAPHTRTLIIETDGTLSFYGHTIEGGWVDINVHIPSYHFN